MDDQQRTDEGLRELALFAGAGGGILGGTLLGWRTVCAVEIDPYAASVLVARQNDGILPPFPIWDDIRTFDGRPWRGIVDVVSGGFPCQDISCAGRGAGIDGERSGLWSEMARVVSEVRPRFAFVENSPMLTSRGLHRVCGDLAEIGYDCKWITLGAGHLYYPIKRDRLWILGINYKVNVNRTLQIHKGADIKRFIWSTELHNHISDVETSWLISNGYAAPEPYGLASELDEIRCIGNGQVPAVAAAAWEILSERRIKED